MTNNTATQQPELLSDDAVRALKRDDLRKYAAQLGIKGASKLSRENLTIVVLNEIAERRPAVEEKNDVEEKTVRVRTSHADCDHPSTKVARAKCRRARAAAQKNN